MLSFKWTPEQILSTYRIKSFPIWTGEYNLNLGAVRSSDLNSNEFNDWIWIFHFRPNGCLAFYVFQATTDPGLYWRHNLANVDGTGIMPYGYHSGLWKKGMHRGKYPCLVQARKLAVLRDPDRDSELDINEAILSKPDWYAAQLHHANDEKSSTLVGKWSALCQVTAAPEDLQFIMKLFDKQEKFTGYNTISYAVFSEKDLNLL